MKKVILSLFVMGAMSLLNGSFAQGNSASSGSTESIARKALKDAGCLDDNGSYTYSTSLLGGCACGPATTCAWYEVIVYPNPNNNSKIAYKLGPVGRVTLCGDEVLTVECLP